MPPEFPDNSDLLLRINLIDRKTDQQTAKIDALFDKLMVPQPGQEKSLLDRMASVTIAVEGGKGVGRLALWVAGVLAAVGGIVAFFHGGAGH